MDVQLYGAIRGSLVLRVRPVYTMAMRISKNVKLETMLSKLSARCLGSQRFRERICPGAMQLFKIRLA